MLRRPFWCICEFIVALAWRDAAPDFLSLDRPSPSLTPDSLIAKAEASSGAANQSANESYVTPEALLSVLREEHKKNRRLRKRLYRMMHRESENFSETVTAARSMQRDLSSYLQNLTHQAWRKSAKTHRSTSNLERSSFDRSAEQTPEEDSLTFPDYETELETNMELRNRLAQLESYFDVQADQWKHALSATSEHATQQSRSGETTVPGQETSPSQAAEGAETTLQSEQPLQYSAGTSTTTVSEDAETMSEQTRQSGAGTTTTTVSSDETQGPQSGSQTTENAETMSEQTRQSGAGTTTTTVSSDETQGPQSGSQTTENAETMSEQTRQSGAGTTTTTVSSDETQRLQSGSQTTENAETMSEQTRQSGAGTTTTTMTSSESRRGGAPSTTKTTNTKQQQPGKKPEQSIPAGAQESGAVTTTEYHLSTEPEEIVEIGPGGSGSTDTTSQAPAAVKTSTRTSQRIVSTPSRPRRTTTTTAQPTTSTEEPARARAVGKTAHGPEAAEAAATEEAEAASWFRGGRREPEPNATRASSEHADADQPSQWSKERLDVAEGNEIKFGFSRSDQ